MKFFTFGKEGIFKSIFTAYMILLLHVALLAGVGVSVILFRGLYQYLPWIVAAITILVLAMAWMVYRKMRADSAQLKDIVGLPEFRDRDVEVRLMGGLLSFKMSAPRERPAMESLPYHRADSARRIAHTVNDTERRILELTALYEKNLITREDFENAKLTILQG